MRRRGRIDGAGAGARLAFAILAAALLGCAVLRAAMGAEPARAPAIVIALAAPAIMALAAGFSGLRLRSDATGERPLAAPRSDGTDAPARTGDP